MPLRGGNTAVSKRDGLFQLRAASFRQDVAAVFNRNARGVRGTRLDVTDTQDSAATFTRTAGGVRGSLQVGLGGGV